MNSKKKQFNFLNSAIIYLSLSLLFSCSKLNEEASPKKDVISKTHKSGQDKRGRLSHIVMQGSVNTVQAYNYKNNDLVEVHTLFYNTPDTAPTSYTKTVINKNTEDNVDLVQLHDVDVVNLNEKSIESFEWIKSGNIHTSSCSNNSIYFGSYYKKHYEVNHKDQISHVFYSNQKNESSLINRSYFYNEINGNSILSIIDEQRNGKSYNQSCIYVSDEMYSNPFSILSGSYLPLFTDLFIDNDYHKTPFYGLNQCINSSEVFPKKQIFIVSENQNIEASETIKIEVCSTEQTEEGIYPKSVKITHTGLKDLIRHKTQTYTISFCYNKESRDEDSTSLNPENYPLKDIFKYHSLIEE